jgi:hypothetical protein
MFTAYMFITHISFLYAAYKKCLNLCIFRIYVSNRYMQCNSIHAAYIESHIYATYTLRRIYVRSNIYDVLITATYNLRVCFLYFDYMLHIRNVSIFVYSTYMGIYVPCMCTCSACNVAHICIHLYVTYMSHIFLFRMGIMRRRRSLAILCEKGL